MATLAWIDFVSRILPVVCLTLVAVVSIWRNKPPRR